MRVQAKAERVWGTAAVLSKLGKALEAGMV